MKFEGGHLFEGSGAYLNFPDKVDAYSSWGLI